MTSKIFKTLFTGKFGLLLKMSALLLFSIFIHLAQQTDYTEEVLELEDSVALLCECEDDAKCLQEAYLSISPLMLDSEEFFLEQERQVNAEECFSTVVAKSVSNKRKFLKKKAYKEKQIASLSLKKEALKKIEKEEKSTPNVSNDQKVKNNKLKEILIESIVLAEKELRMLNNEASIKAEKLLENGGVGENTAQTKKPIVIEDYKNFSNALGEEVLVTQKNGTQFVARLVDGKGKGKGIDAKRFVSGGTFTFPVLEKNIKKIEVITKYGLKLKDPKKLLPKGNVNE